MNGLAEYFRERLPSKIEALLAARDGIERDPDAGLGELRHLTHSLRGSAGSYGFPRISAAAGLVESAPLDQIDATLEALISSMREAFDDDAEQSAVMVVTEQVSDVQEIRDALRQVTRDVLHVASAAEAMRVLDERPVGLVIVDLVLPDRDGRSLVMKLRESPATSAIPLFVMSALGSSRIKAECLALGAQQFIEKPLDAEVLAAAATATLQFAGDAVERWSTDPLTELPNRAAFGETFRRAAAFSSRQGRPLSIGIVDLDRFKSVNDEHGHGVGDSVLRGTARVLSAQLRESDSVARWGGEEFVVLFPDTPERGGVAALDKVQGALSAVEFETPSGRGLTISFSGGVTQVRERESLGEVLARADGHLYRAKAAGRRRVFCAADAGALPARTVLVVEDDDAMAKLIETTLACGAVGAEVLHCRDGEEALRRLESTSVSLGILDVNMPRMDGFTLLERMRAIPALATIPVVMLTGRGDEADVVRGLSLGADDYVVKPFSVAELSLRVRRLIKAG